MMDRLTALIDYLEYMYSGIRMLHLEWIAQGGNDPWVHKMDHDNTGT